MAVDIDVVAQVNAKLVGKIKMIIDWIGNPTSVIDYKVTSVNVVASKDMVFDKAQQTTLPDIALLAQKKLLNCSAATTLTSAVSLTLTGTRSWSVSKTEGVSTTIGATIKGSIDVVELGFSWSQSVSASTAVNDTQLETVTRTMSDSVVLGPNKAVNVSLVAYQKGIAIPFTATVTVDQDMPWPNRVTLQAVSDSHNVAKLSQILSVEDRTFQVTGVLTVSDVLDGTIRTDDLEGADGCGGTTSGIFTQDSPQESIEPSLLAARFTKSFLSQELTEKAKAKLESRN